MIDESTEGKFENLRDRRQPRNPNIIWQTDKIAQYPPKKQPQQEPAI